jgi:hypothetical protein
MFRMKSIVKFIEAGMGSLRHVPRGRCILRSFRVFSRKTHLSSAYGAPVQAGIEKFPAGTRCRLATRGRLSTWWPIAQGCRLARVLHWRRFEWHITGQRGTIYFALCTISRHMKNLHRSMNCTSVFFLIEWRSLASLRMGYILLPPVRYQEQENSQKSNK